MRLVSGGLLEELEEEVRGMYTKALINLKHPASID